LLSEYIKYIIGDCLPNKKTDLVFDNKDLNFFNNIRKSIDFLIIIFLEYSESIIIFLEFNLFINTKIIINNRTNNNIFLSRSFY
jgi:hypothetical protein